MEKKNQFYLVLILTIVLFMAVVVIIAGMLRPSPALMANQVIPEVRKAVLYVSSASGNRMTRKSDVLMGNYQACCQLEIVIDTTVRYQVIEGFGATFNESGMICLNALQSDRRDSVLKSLFDPVTGAGYTAMKSPIAACDFASAGPWYSYNDTPGDTLMHNFSIKRDLEPNGLITYIKSASRFGKFIIESPMDFAPDWMLVGLNQGEKHVRKEYYPALARYYSRYISEYAKNGVTIDYLNPFNEPQNSWYSNETYKAIGNMVKDFIVPRLRTDGLNTRIQLCETCDRPEALKKLPDALDDPEVMKHISSITVHGYDYDKFSSLTELHIKYPNLPVWMTEVCYAPTNGNIPVNGPKYAPVYEFEDGGFWGNMIMNDMKNYVSAWIYWNMILDENGGPWLVSKIHGDPDNNRQHPVVIVNRTTGKVTYTGLYYYLAHFSRFIRPGAIRVESSGGIDQFNFSAFRNPDRSVVLVIINNGDEARCAVRLGDNAGSVFLYGHSISTLIIKGQI